MTEEFGEWWNKDDLTTQSNPLTKYGTPAYWAWRGWCAGVKAEREACANVCEEQEELRGHTPFDCADAIRARSNT